VEVHCVACGRTHVPFSLEERGCLIDELLRLRAEVTKATAFFFNEREYFKKKVLNLETQIRAKAEKIHWLRQLLKR
jgi:hypothetical protein